MTVTHSSGLIKDIAHGRFLPATTNFVKRMLYSNCQVPFYIYVETFVPAFVYFALTLTILQWDDIVRERAARLSPRAARPGRPGHHTRRKLWKNALPKDTGRGYALANKHLLALTAPIEYIGFHLLVYGAIDNFFYDWAVAIDDADACVNSAFFGPLVKRNDAFAVIPSDPGGAVSLPVEVSNPAHWSNTAFGVSLPIGRYTVVMGLTMTGPSGGPTSYKLGCLVTGAVTSGWIYGEEREFQPGEEGDLMLSFDAQIFFSGGGDIAWALSGPAVPIGVSVAKADIYIQRHSTAF